MFCDCSLPRVVSAQATVGHLKRAACEAHGLTPPSAFALFDYFQQREAEELHCGVFAQPLKAMHLADKQHVLLRPATAASVEGEMVSGAGAAGTTTLTVRTSRLAQWT
jgi:hypothetical protein